MNNKLARQIHTHYQDKEAASKSAPAGFVLWDVFLTERAAKRVINDYGFKDARIVDKGEFFAVYIPAGDRA